MDRQSHPYGTILPIDDKWLQRGLALAFDAAAHSHDPSRKVGAVIIDGNNQLIASAANALPNGVQMATNRVTDRNNGEKYYWIEHAERNAIFDAAKRGIPLSGTIIFSTLFPCADCARAIIQSGLTALVIPEGEKRVLRFERSTEVARTMLTEAGVNVIEVTNPSSTPK